MRVSQIVLLLVAVVVLVSAIVHILNAQQNNQMKMAKKLLKMTEYKKMVRSLMAGRRDPLNCTRATAGDKPVVIFQIDNLHVLADQRANYLKPIAAFDDREDIYEFCRDRGEPIKEYGNIVFVPKVPREDLADKTTPKRSTGWFSKIKRFIGLESTTTNTTADESV